MNDLFRTYEEEFIRSLSAFNKALEGLSVISNQKKELAFSDLKSDLNECEKSYKLMETQISVLPPQLKIDMLRKIRGYKRDFDNARKVLFKAQDDYSVEKSKEMLMGAELEDMRNSRFIRDGTLLTDGTYQLKESLKVMQQTEEISTNVQYELDGHTKRLINNKHKIGEIKGELNRGEKLIKTMMLRIRRNKFIFFSVIAAIFLVVIIILGVYFSKKASAQSNTNG